jgi:hypothetical protein
VFAKSNAGQVSEPGVRNGEGTLQNIAGIRGIDHPALPEHQVYFGHRQFQQAGAREANAALLTASTQQIKE